MENDNPVDQIQELTVRKLNLECEKIALEKAQLKKPLGQFTYREIVTIGVAFCALMATWWSGVLDSRRSVIQAENARLELEKEKVGKQVDELHQQQLDLSMKVDAIRTKEAEEQRKLEISIKAANAVRSIKALSSIVKPDDRATPFIETEVTGDSNNYNVTLIYKQPEELVRGATGPRAVDYLLLPKFLHLLYQMGPTLHSVEIYGIKLDAGNLVDLSKLSSRSFKLVACGIDDSYISNLHLQSPTDIDLSGNRISKMPTVDDYSQLQLLGLAYTKVGDELLITLFREAKNLMHVDLSNNKSVSQKSISAAFNPRLSHVRVRGSNIQMKDLIPLLIVSNANHIIVNDFDDIVAGELKAALKTYERNTMILVPAVDEFDALSEMVIQNPNKQPHDALKMIGGFDYQKKPQ